MNDSIVNSLNMSEIIQAEAQSMANATKKDHTLYIWNVKGDSFDYVIAATDEAMPDVVKSFYVAQNFIYKETP